MNTHDARIRQVGDECHFLETVDLPEAAAAVVVVVVFYSRRQYRGAV